MEPFFIAQTADTKTAEERHDWIRTRGDEAKADGSRHGRVSFDPENNLLLMECWKEVPIVDGQLREGNPRWQLVAIEQGTEGCDK